VKSSQKLDTDYYQTKTWVFDLDNTLYPHHSNVFAQMDVKMGGYIADLLKVDPVQARIIQKDYLMRYGTTLRGLMHHHNVDPHHYLSVVHDIDISPIEENTLLRQSLKDLPGRKLVFTNADHPYAERVINRIGIGDTIDGIFDIHDAYLIPKPTQDAYDTFIKKFNVNPKDAVMVEDISRNLVPAKTMGMRTVWVNTGSKWGHHENTDDHVDIEINDLSQWLQKIVSA